MLPPIQKSKNPDDSSRPGFLFLLSSNTNFNVHNHSQPLIDADSEKKDSHKAESGIRPLI